MYYNVLMGILMTQIWRGNVRFSKRRLSHSLCNAARPFSNFARRTSTDGQKSSGYSIITMVKMKVGMSY
jgi:hypothetical protein